MKKMIVLLLALSSIVLPANACIQKATPLSGAAEKARVLDQLNSSNPAYYKQIVKALNISPGNDLRSVSVAVIPTDEYGNHNFKKYYVMGNKKTIIFTKVVSRDGETFRDFSVNDGGPPNCF